MAPWRASTTKSEWLLDDPTGFVPTRVWKLPCITTWDDSRNQNQPTDSAEEADKPRHRQAGTSLPGLGARIQRSKTDCYLNGGAGPAIHHREGHIDGSNA